MAPATKRLTKSPEMDQVHIIPAHRGKLPGLSIRLIGLLHHKQKWLERQNAEDALCIIESGSGTLRDAQGLLHQFQAPAVLWFPAGCRVGYGPDTWWRERFVVVEGPRIETWRHAGWLLDGCHCWNPAEAQAASAAHRLALASCAIGSDDASDAACLAIDQFIFACRPQPSMRADPLAAVVATWRNNPADADIASGAMAADLSSSRFRALINQRYGLSPQRLIQSERIAMACRELLLNTDGLKSIARRCGYSSLETFLRAFRRETGSTPGMWRRRHAPT